jgi:hypothetical protein
MENKRRAPNRPKSAVTTPAIQHAALWTILKKEIIAAKMEAVEIQAATRTAALGILTNA